MVQDFVHPQRKRFPKRFNRQSQCQVPLVYCTRPAGSCKIYGFDPRGFFGRASSLEQVTAFQISVWPFGVTGPRPVRRPILVSWLLGGRAPLRNSSQLLGHAFRSISEQLDDVVDAKMRQVANALSRHSEP